MCYYFGKYFIMVSMNKGDQQGRCLQKRTWLVAERKGLVRTWGERQREGEFKKIKNIGKDIDNSTEMRGQVEE